MVVFDGLENLQVKGVFGIGIIVTFLNSSVFRWRGKFINYIIKNLISNLLITNCESFTSCNSKLGYYIPGKILTTFSYYRIS